MRIIIYCLSIFVLFPASVMADSFDLKRLRQPGHLVLIRHALAPGIGDPDHFQLRNCATQRNLDATGKAQAQEIGKRLKEAGVTNPLLYSSQWCRCLETAQLMQLGPVTELPALNSFFNRPSERSQRLAALSEFFRNSGPETPTAVMITHQVTITAVTDIFPASGEAVVLKLDGTTAPQMIGRFKAF